MKTAGRKKYIVIALGVLTIAVVAAFGPSMYSAWQKRQLVERLKDVGEWNTWRALDDYQTKIDLSKTDLSGADLSSANLYGASLRYANLRGASFRDSLLNLADLTGADLTQADFSGAIISGANFTEATLFGTEFRPYQRTEGHWSFDRFRGWSSANFKGANIYGIKNPPEGFIEFALKQGAVQVPPRSEKEVP